MTLEYALKAAVRKLGSGQLENEAQVKQAVILPVLRSLDWADDDPDEFRPEYPVPGGGFVDYALFVRQEAYVFVEAKNVGKMNVAGEEQLFRYASNRGVPFLILTDGYRWDFYLSMAAGIPKDRLFYRLNLKLEGNIQDYVQFLEDHLRKERIASGEAKDTAEKLLKDKNRRDRAKREIPNAWKALLKEPGEILRDLLIQKVEDNCKIKPAFEDVEEFLRSHATSYPPSLPNPQPPRPPEERWNPPPPEARHPPKSAIIGFVLDGTRHETGTARGTLAEIVKLFDREHPRFMERFAEITASRARNLVARDRADLYLRAPHLLEQSCTDLQNGWFLGTHLSTDQITKHIRTACRVVEVGFDTQLKLIRR